MTGQRIRFAPCCVISELFSFVRTALAAILGLALASASAQTFIKELAPAEIAVNQFFGSCIAANATHIAVGSSDDSAKGPGAGSVSVFSQSTGARIRKHYSPFPHALDFFGVSVAVAGNILAVGAPFADSPNTFDQGSVYLFNLTTGAWIPPVITGTQTGESFGNALAADGDLLVIGAPFHDAGGAISNAGAIYVYNLRTRSLSGPITALFPSSQANFGMAVAVEGKRIAIGAPFEMYIPGATGTAYLYDATVAPATFAKGPFLPISQGGSFEGAPEDQFGFSVALSRGFLVVSAPFKTLASTNEGKIYAYKVDGSNADAPVWTWQGGSTSSFGWALAASSDLLTVGAPDWGEARGRAYVFQIRNGTHVQTLSAPDATLGPGPGDMLGRAVAITGATVLATAPARDTRAPDGGAAFKFSPVRPPLPFRELVLKGNTPPGALDTTFSAFLELASPPNGFNCSIRASVTGTGAAGGKNTGIWHSQAIGIPALQKVQRSGFDLAGRGKAISVSRPVYNVQGLHGFSALISGPNVTAANDTIFAVCRDSDMWIPLAEGVTRPFGMGTVMNNFVTPRQTTRTGGETWANCFATSFTWRVGGTGATAVNATDDSGLLVFTTITHNVLIREDQPSPPPFFSPEPVKPVKYGQFLPRVSLNGARLAYAAMLQSPATSANNLAAFESDAGFATRLARKGDPAPSGALGTFGTFTNFLAESSSSSATAFRATIAPPPSALAKTEGIWSNRADNVVLAALYKRENYAALPPGVSIARFLHFAIDGSKDIFAWVTLQGTGVTAANDGALLLSKAPLGGNPESGSIQVLLREGDAAPGCGRARVAAIQRFDVHEHGGYAVLASLVVEAGGATLTDNQALFLGRPGEQSVPVLRLPFLVLRKGQQFVRNGSPTVQSISLPGYIADASGALNTGLAHVVAALPSCNAVVTFSDGQTSVMHVTQ
jgi:hypothetical protein